MLNPEKPGIAKTRAYSGAIGQVLFIRKPRLLYHPGMTFVKHFLFFRHIALFCCHTFVNILWIRFHGKYASAISGSLLFCHGHFCATWLILMDSHTQPNRDLFKKVRSKHFHEKRRRMRESSKLPPEHCIQMCSNSIPKPIKNAIQKDGVFYWQRMRDSNLLNSVH